MANSLIESQAVPAETGIVSERFINEILKSDDVVDAFYVLDYNSNKISSDRYELISVELTKSIEELL